MALSNPCTGQELIAEINGHKESIEHLLAQPFTKIATGSYIGTGTVGKDNALILTFDSKPLCVWVIEPITVTNNSIDVATPQPFINGMKQADHGVSGQSSHPLVLTWGDNSVIWYIDQTATSGWTEGQLNKLGMEYVYVAWLE